MDQALWFPAPPWHTVGLSPNLPLPGSCPQPWLKNLQLWVELLHAGLHGRLPPGSLALPALPLGWLLATLDIRADGAWERMEAGARQPRNLGSEGL